MDECMLIYMSLNALILLSIIIVLVIYGLRKPKPIPTDLEYDVLVQHSSETLPIAQFVREMTRYNPDFITGSQISWKQPYSETFDKKDIPNAYTSFSQPSRLNYTTQISSKYREVCMDNNYMAASREKFSAQKKNPIYYHILPYEIMMFVVKLIRLDDEVEFYQVMMTQKFKSYKSDQSYNGIHAAISFLKEKYPGEYIISGDFNVVGHERVFRHLLPNYHICDFTKMPTCLDHEGIASPDGVIVSPALYTRVEYYTALCGVESYQHLVVVAKLYRKHPKSGVAYSSDWKLEHMTKDLAPSQGAFDNFYGDEGNFDPAIHNETIPVTYKPTEIKETARILKASNMPKPAPPVPPAPSTLVSNEPSDSAANTNNVVAAEEPLIVDNRGLHL